MDSRTRRGVLAVQFEQLVAAEVAHQVIIDTPVVRVSMTRYNNVVSCSCELATADGLEALARRGAVEDTFMISHKLPPRDFGIWLDQLLVEDLGADAEVDLQIREPLLL